MCRVVEQYLDTPGYGAANTTNGWQCGRQSQFDSAVIESRLRAASMTDTLLSDAIEDGVLRYKLKS
jgi:hypothetical protein